MSPPLVVILAAGEGTRMRSQTPKLLHPVCGRPMIAWSVAAAREAGAGQIVVVQAPGRELDGALGDDVAVAVQEQARGTADAVRSAVEQIRESQVGTVIVVNGDHPLVRPETIEELAAVHMKSGAAATIGTAILDDPGGYGRVVRAPDGTVERVAESKKPGDASEHELHIREVNTGMFAFDAQELLAALERVGSDNSQREYYLPDVLPIMRSDERTVLAHEVSDPGAMMGVNDRAQLARVRALAQAQIHHRHMLAGVTIVDPSTTVIDADVEIAADAVIAPFTSLHGSSRVGTGSTVGPLTTLLDTTVGEGSRVIHAYSDRAQIGDRVSVGPFAYLRPGTVMHGGSKAGAFVEVKNSEIGPGSKVPHLSYIGDATIGEGTNIGAGTITANYDGTNKHRTEIGSDVFIGVDTMLVAPVTIHDGAYTGGGSVITKDVPPGALGIARERQKNIEGYMDRRKEREERKHEPEADEQRQAPDVNSEPA